MFEIGMQEHVGDELIDMEKRRTERQGAVLHDRIARLRQQRRGHEDQDVDDYQIQHHRGRLEIIPVHKLSFFSFVAVFSPSRLSGLQTRPGLHSQARSCGERFSIFRPENKPHGAGRIRAPKIYANVRFSAGLSQLGPDIFDGYLGGYGFARW